ncbi:MAG TPA: SEC-C metal-binding domain-containing protein [Lentibacillus sp.]|uniref:YecA family protein n=1 Tax=Lentibacillus sp. TaxID=1925746 RepID=UPI002B4B3D28|nr:SEC-C metal-binding domain-containing protein [Lentibacillus sp.]HLR61538.1 SEC-C metal-binding domain-containing protein [Lentibacillus sp.]
MGLLIDYIIALTHLYGLVHKGKVVEIYNMQNDENAGAADVDDRAKNNENELEKSFVYLHGDYFVHETIMVFDEFEQELAKRQGKPFYIPGQKELMKYKDDLYFERTKAYNALKKYVQQHFFNGDASKAEELCEDIHGECQFGFSLDEVFRSFEWQGIVFESENQVQKVMELVMDLSNNVRLWENNGFTPDELIRTERPMLRPLPDDPFHVESKSGMSQETTAAAKQDGKTAVNKKVGRNDPCPCGSGKKYKKCCLV